ncbi:MarR family winged helix-turn-helix transcriptional regulator [Cellulomonas bogoriensis]|nr:MarR family transcriptional regulator [Cellulomonas bogoriensis]
MTGSTLETGTAPPVPHARDASAGEDAQANWLTPEQQVHWRAYLLGTARLSEALTRQLEADAGLSLSEYEILVRLSEAPERTVRMSELADSLVHSRSRLTHTVSRMEKRGLVRRVSCEVDARGVNCVMTHEGFALLASAAPGHVTAVRANLLDLLTEEQFTVLGEVMAAVVRGPAGGVTTA